MFIGKTPLCVKGNSFPKNYLRIDNSRHSVICTFGLTSGTMSCTLTYYMSKNRAHFSLSDDVNDIFVIFDFIQILV